MKLSCPGCGNASEIPDDSLPPVGARGRCHRCGRTTVFTAVGLVDEDPTPVNSLDALEFSADDLRPPDPAPADPPTDPEAWMVRRPAGEDGPFDFAGLKTLIRADQLLATDDVRPAAGPVWIPAAEVPGLKRYFTIKAKAPASPAANGIRRCRRHPAAEADFHCTSCGGDACSACVVTKDVNRIRIQTCAACGGALVALVKPRVVVPFWKDWGAVFSYPFRGGGWIAILVCAVIGTMGEVALVAPLYGRIAWLILNTSLLAYLLFVLRSSSEGKTEVPDLGHVGDWKREMFYPGLKAMVLFLVVFLPFFLYRIIVIPATGLYSESDGPVLGGMVDPDDPDLNLSEEERSALRQFPGAELPPGVVSEGDEVPAYGDGDEEVEPDFAAEAEAAAERQQEARYGGVDGEQTQRENEKEEGWALPGYLAKVRPIHVIAQALLIVYAIALLPILLIILALFDTIRPAFSPPLLFRIIDVMKKEYGILVAFVLGMSILETIVAGPLLELGPLVGVPLSQVVGFYSSFVIFHAIGRLAYQVEDRINWY